MTEPSRNLTEITSGSRAREWPPSPRPAGVDLPVGWLLLVFLGIEATWVLSAKVLNVGTIWWSTGEPKDALTQTLPWLIHAAIALGVVIRLGWSSVVGLTVPALRHPPDWGVAPILLFAGIAVVDATRLPAYVLPAALLGAMVINFATSAFVEELVYRGYLVHGLTVKLGGTIAILASATLSALVHFVPSGRSIGVAPFAFFFCFAVVMSWIRSATGSIWYGALAHACFNVFTTIDIWLFRLHDPWPPGAFVHRGTTVLGLALTTALVIWTTFRWLLRLAGTDADPFTDSGSA